METPDLPSEPLEAVLRRAVLWPLLAAVCLSIFLLVQVSRLIEANEWVDHTDRIISQAYLAQGLIIDLEAGLHGYRLFHDHLHLDLFEKARTQLPQTLADLQHSVREDPSQVTRLRKIRKYASRYLKDYRKILENPNLLAKGTSLVAARKVFNDFFLDESALREERLQKSRVNGQIMLGLGSFFTIVLGLFLGIFTKNILRKMSNRHHLMVARLQKQAEENERLAQQAQKNIARLDLAQKVGQIGSFEYDMVNNVNMWSTELEALYGLKPGEFGGTYEDFAHMVHPDDLPRIEIQAAEAIAHNQEFWTEFRIVRPDGGIRWMQTRAQTIRDETGNPTRIIGVNLDVTIRHENEERLKLLALDLRKAVDVRDDFLSIASHELKTPLTSLKLQIQALERTTRMRAIPSPGHIRKVVDVANKQVLRLTELIEKLLDLARIRGGQTQLNYTDVDLSKMVSDIVERTVEQWRSYKPLIKVDSHLPVVAKCDVFRMEQVVTNLLTNAMKYGDEKPIEVSVHHEFGRAVIKICDHGIGIDKDKQEKIFERFERAVSSRHIGGLGLGLFIVRQNILAHRGTIDVNSQPGRGATFIIKIPLLPIDTLIVAPQTG